MNENMVLEHFKEYLHEYRIWNDAFMFSDLVAPLLIRMSKFRRILTAPAQLYYNYKD